MKIIDQEHKNLLRENFVTEYGASVDMIEEDDLGEFVMLEPEEGEIDEDGKMTTFSGTKKLYLPIELQRESPLGHEENCRCPDCELLNEANRLVSNDKAEKNE